MEEQELIYKMHLDMLLAGMMLDICSDVIYI